ncbi:hypothetical protein CsatB_029679 [Cannabis sativa]
MRGRVSSQFSKASSDRANKSIVLDSSSTFTNPTFQAGSIDEAWYDSILLFDSDCDEDYQSVQDGMNSGESWELGHQIDQDLFQLLHEDHPRLRSSPPSIEGHSSDLVPSHRMMARTKKTMRLADATDPQVAQLATQSSTEQDSAVPMEEDREGDGEVHEVEELDVLGFMP